MSELKPCPICGKKAYISRDEPDGFFMGWSVGCPAYKKDDGVYEINAAFHNITTKQRAVEKWNKYCEVIESENNRRCCTKATETYEEEQLLEVERN